MTKVISMSNKAYEVLSRLKREKESFSDVVLRLSKREGGHISHFAGKWHGKDAEEVFAEVIEERHKIRSREVEL